MTETSERGAAEGTRRAELAAFLKTRRAKIQPGDVGLPDGVRRRAAGLRREEVAQLAGVGLSWYTWLEQGRAINASTQVLDALATTLRMDPVEREHLHVLAGAVPLRGQADDLVIPDAVFAILRSLDPLPATLATSRLDTLGTNEAFQVLFAGWHDLGCLHHNGLWCTITEPNARRWLPDYDDDIAYLVARLRSNYARHIGDPEWEANIARLSATSPEFAKIWARQEVAEPCLRSRRVMHPDLGLMNFTLTQLDVAFCPEVYINVYTPSDAETWALLARTRQG
ncbi:transcriptional regulator with XRE-family HTH domain [Catenulispora sp. MAP12-49]|uniref:helix-turn-helix transcriptional regulator n=1 Tax=Catenulispora sp. MAP12-49 TaxID=3156302 RepID=UPI0035146054